MGNLATNIPGPQSPLVDPTTGIITQPWWYLLQGLLSRTGGVSGNAKPVSPSAVVTVGASPFPYAATTSGFLVVSGGGVSSMTIKRGAGAAYAVGSFYAAHPVSNGDIVTISYVAAPKVTFFPQ